MAEVVVGDGFALELIAPPQALPPPPGTQLPLAQQNPLKRLEDLCTKSTEDEVLFEHRRDRDAEEAALTEDVAKLVISDMPMYFSLLEHRRDFVSTLIRAGLWPEPEAKIKKNMGGQRLIAAYAKVYRDDPELFCEVIVKHFYEGCQSRAQRDELAASDVWIPPPCDALYTCAQFLRLARERRQSGRATEEDLEHIDAMLKGMQTTLVELLQTLELFSMKGGWTLLDDLLGSEQGLRVLSQLAVQDASTLLTSSSMQAFFVRQWRGSLLAQLLTERQYGGKSPRRFSYRIVMLRWGIVILATLVNIIALPLVTVYLLFDASLPEASLDSPDEQVIVASTERKWDALRWIGGDSPRASEVASKEHSKSTRPSALIKSNTQRMSRKDLHDRGWRRKPPPTVHGFELSIATDDDDASAVGGWWGISWRKVAPFYLLEEPWLEDLLFISSEFAQLLLLTFMYTNPDSESVEARQKLSLLWGGAVLLAEVEQAFTQGPIYFMDVLHLMQLVGLVLVLSATSFDLTHDEYRSEVDALMSIGLLLLWLQQLKVLYKFPTIGVLVRSMYTAFRDVLRWFMLQSILLFAFGAAFFALFRTETSKTAACGLSLKSLENRIALENRTMPLFERLYINSQGFFYFTPLLEAATGVGNFNPTCFTEVRNSFVGPMMVSPAANPWTPYLLCAHNPYRTRHPLRSSSS